MWLDDGDGAVIRCCSNTNGAHKKQQFAWEIHLCVSQNPENVSQPEVKYMRLWNYWEDDTMLDLLAKVLLPLHNLLLYSIEASVLISC